MSYLYNKNHFYLTVLWRNHRLLGSRRNKYISRIKEGKDLHALGTHLLVELKKCNPKKLADAEYVEASMSGAREKSHATNLGGDFFHDFDPGGPGGITGVVPIAESHLSIHTWPEYAYAMVDVLTCGNKMDPWAAVRHLIEAFECDDPSVIEIKRGIIDPFADTPPPHKPLEET